MGNNLNKKIGQAVKWSSAAQIATKLIAPITNAVLARLLAPSAFGVVATLTMVVSFAELFTDAGFQRYLVQHEFENQEELDKGTNVAFWTNLGFSLLFWAVISLFAEPVASLVGSPGCGPAVAVVCIQIPLHSFSSIQMARYRRDLNFKTLFTVQITTAVIPLVVTIPLAIIFRSYWALVMGTLARGVVSALLLTLRSPWKIRFWYSVDKLKDMLSFSLWTMIENIFVWFTSYIDVFLVSTFLSAHFLGLYKTSMNTVNGYMAIVTGATTSVLFVALSRNQNDREEFKAVFGKFQSMVSLLVMPMGLGLYAYRELATTILLGNQWLETADFVGLWSLISAIMIIFDNYCSVVFRSMGKPKLSALLQVLYLGILIPVLFLVADKGYRVLTTTRALTRLVGLISSCIAVRIVSGIKVTDMLKNVWPAAISAVVMALSGTALRSLYDNLIWEMASVVICVMIYAGTMLLIPAGRRQMAQIPILQKIFHLKTVAKEQEK